MDSKFALCNGPRFQRTDIFNILIDLLIHKIIKCEIYLGSHVRAPSTNDVTGKDGKNTECDVLA